MGRHEREALLRRVFPHPPGLEGLKADLEAMRAGGALREHLLWRYGQMDRMRRACGMAPFLTTSLQRFACFHAREVPRAPVRVSLDRLRLWLWRAGRPH